MGKYQYSRQTADGQVRAVPGFLHSITIAPTTATPTPGVLTVYDSTTEAGNIVFRGWVFATDPSKTLSLNVSCHTGIYVGYDAALDDVSVTVAHGE